MTSTLKSGFRFLLPVGLCLMLIPLHADAQKMDNKALRRILKTVTDTLEGRDGMWQLWYSDRLMFVITDEAYDRMRIITPVRVMSDVSHAEMEEAMLANFHSVLDVRYAISDEMLWAAFIHPLSPLSEKQVRDGLLQVFRAAETFGTTYSSTELIFPRMRKTPGESPPETGRKM